MTYRTVRRRMSEAAAAHSWLEGFAFVLGLAFLALAVMCVWGIVTAIANVGDAEAPSGQPVTVGFLEVTRGFALVLFALFGFLALGVGWFLAGDTLKRWFALGRARAKDRS
jgi:ABC-type amino acid transport system permease subunit